MEKVQNSAIQMSFYQVGITFVARFIGREWFACDLIEKAESLECRFHKFQARFLGEIQAVSRINDCANNGGIFDFLRF